MADYDWFDREPRRIPEYEKHGFKAVEMSQFNFALECPACFALIKRDLSGTDKESSRWWKHLLWHVNENDEDWAW